MLIDHLKSAGTNDTYQTPHDRSCSVMFFYPTSHCHNFHNNNRLCDVMQHLYFKLRLYLHMDHIDASLNTVT